MQPLLLSPTHLKGWVDAMQGELITHPDAPGQFAILNLFGQNTPVRVAFFDTPAVCWFFVELSEKVPEERYDAVRETLVSLNATIFLGSWNLRARDGQLYFKIALPASHGLFTHEGLRSLCEVAIATVKKTGATVLHAKTESSVS